MDIIIAGFGNVGQGFAQILHEKATSLTTRYGFTPRITGVTTFTRGSLYHPDGLDLSALLTAIGSGSLDHYPDAPGLQRGLTAMDMIRDGRAAVLVEATPSNLVSGQPALDLCYTAIDAGMHVVLANKGPVAVDYAGLKARADAAGVYLRFEATVMAGTPALRLALQDLAGSEITAVRGILNGTTNYMLVQMEQGMTYADALKQAQALGYAETDPVADVEGFDSAGKAIILSAAIYGTALTLEDMPITGITGLTPDDISAARAAGERWKLLATVTRDGASVEPVRVPLESALAGVSGATNAITLTTDLLGNVTLVGPGAGRVQTGFALLTDIIDIRQRNS